MIKRSSRFLLDLFVCVIMRLDLIREIWYNVNIQKQYMVIKRC